MCGGWACASYSLACNNPPLSTLRYTGREFIPTPCGPHDKCFANDTSRNRGNCMRPQSTTVEMNPCLDLTKAEETDQIEADVAKQAKDNWKLAYAKVKCTPAEDGSKKGD
ncbi:uncharacterized protein LOC135439407 [Drosophila montana]|uniref:uncharacterized protein LOC135439407 n=1 Tax=Drosophila montana TaxID=40370 RepID=UPI00313ACA4F